MHDRSLVEAYRRLAKKQAEHARAEARLSAIRAIVDEVARMCGIPEPAHAIALLTQEEQARVYALLKGDSP
jgi:hypothetical protein